MPELTDPPSRSLRGSQAHSSLTLPQGRVHYRDTGPGGPVLVLLHGYLMDSRLWDPVVSRLRDEFRCVTPDLPFGAHPVALDPDADVTVTGVARLVADLLAGLDLDAVTLVGNDSGGAIAQIVAARHAERVGRLVLTNCDAFDNLPPEAFRPLIEAARAGMLSSVFDGLRQHETQALPQAYGGLTRGPVPHELIDSWVAAYFADAGVRRDVGKFTVSLDAGSLMTDVAAELAGFAGPALLAWGTDDAFFPYEHAERLAAILPHARVEPVADSRTWVMVDQPERTAALIRNFVRDSRTVPEGSGTGATR
jgi:pimeloyl-ACP methyl ester carboxylesterase